MNADTWSIVVEYCNVFNKYALWNSAPLFRTIIRNKCPEKLYVLRKNGNGLMSATVPKDSIIYNCPGLHVLLIKGPEHSYSWKSSCYSAQNINWTSNKIAMVANDNIDEFMNIIDTCTFIYDATNMTLLASTVAKEYIVDVGQMTMTKEPRKVTCRILGEKQIDISSGLDYAFTDVKKFSLWSNTELKGSVFDCHTRILLKKIGESKMIHVQFDLLYDHAEYNNTNRPIFVFGSSIK